MRTNLWAASGESGRAPRFRFLVPFMASCLLALPATAAEAQWAPPPHHVPPPRHLPPPPVWLGHTPVTIVRVDRRPPYWWRGRPEFVGYAGVRRGYYFAPGFGYVAVPREYWGRRWVVGGVLPPPLRRYYVVDPLAYGVALPPPGYAWVYAGDGIVLTAIATGLIVDALQHLW